MKFHYQLSKKFRLTEFVERGETPDLDQVLYIDPKESDRDVRSLYTELSGDGRRLQLPPQDDYLEAHEIIPILEALKAKRKEEKIETAKNDAIIAQRRLDRDDEEKARHLAKEERERKEDEAKEARNTEKLRWIGENGSTHLKKAIGGGFDCHRQYLTERAAIEFPGFVFDWNNNALWSDCACPAMATLELLDVLPDKCDVVWLKRRHDDDDGYDEYDECEVIVFRKYLGSKYDLIKYL